MKLMMSLRLDGFNLGYLEKNEYLLLKCENLIYSIEFNILENRYVMTSAC